MYLWYENRHAGRVATSELRPAMLTKKIMPPESAVKETLACSSVSNCSACRIDYFKPPPERREPESSCL